MRIEYRDQQRKNVGRMEVDVAARPTRVPIIERGFHDAQREAFLSWEGVLDDSGQVRRCIACGCPDLFREKAFPQVTGLVVVMAFVGAIVGVLGLANNLPALLGLTALLALDVAILVFSTRRLVCYQCRTSYHNLALARYHRTWDRAIAERYPASNAPATGGMTVAARAQARERGSGGDSAGADAVAHEQAATALLEKPREPEVATYDRSRDRDRSRDGRPGSAPDTFADAPDVPLEKKSYFA
jgi:hypothetical protein